MISRHRSRELAIQLVYQFTVSPQSMADPKTIDRFWNEQAQTGPSARPFFESLVRGTASYLPQIDQAIEAVLENWRLDRLERMDLALLRVGGYEILFGDTPVAVVINEAVEFAKRYGNENSPKFVNGTLDALYKRRKTAGSGSVG